jgi:hypothetical protein
MTDLYADQNLQQVHEIAQRQERSEIVRGLLMSGIATLCLGGVAALLIHTQSAGLMQIAAFHPPLY